VHLARNEKATEQAIAALLITDIYQRAGLNAKIQPLPGARANAMALVGEKDGEVARVQAYASKNTSLIKVEPAYYYLTTTAFAKGDKAITIRSKDDLKKYRVGIVRGIAHAEAATEGIATLQVLRDYDQMYRMLDADRIDVAIDTGVNGAHIVKRLGLKGIQPVGELARLDLFNILAPAKTALAPKIAAAIKSLKDSGELTKLAQRYEAEFAKSGAAP
jgi:polar amino acid transport system substrate-binding protein